MSALCVHFGACGGCATQDIPQTEYRALKRGLVVDALARHGVRAEVAALVAVPPKTRRRCVFKIKDGAVGFHARASHDIVDMRECRVLTPRLTALADALREANLSAAEAHVTEADNGFDILLRWARKPSPALIQKLAPWARKHGVARIVSGSDVLVELAAPVLNGIRLPPGAFLQPTREGEAFLQAQALETLRGAKSVADLFAGCGTFSLALAEHAKVHAVELDGAMLDALAAAARATQGLKPVTAEKRDLFKRPLSARELERFDGACLDPPRAGAATQVVELAKSRVQRIAYISCNAESFARDARVLVDAGWPIGTVTPVDQFLWSEHIELVASFARR